MHLTMMVTANWTSWMATATAAALLGLSATVYMGIEDMRRQRPNVERMRLLGAEVVPVDAGSQTLKDAINEAMRDWMSSVESTHYILGSVVGPNPFRAHDVIGAGAADFLDRPLPLGGPVYTKQGAGALAGIPALHESVKPFSGFLVVEQRGVEQRHGQQQNENGRACV